MLNQRWGVVDPEAKCPFLGVITEQLLGLHSSTKMIVYSMIDTCSSTITIPVCIQ
jgi:hypothetical protein